MAGMDQLREQVMDNHGKVYRSLMRIQDDLSIQGRGVQLRNFRVFKSTLECFAKFKFGGTYFIF